MMRLPVMRVGELEDVWPAMQERVCAMLEPDEVDYMLRSVRAHTAIVLTCPEGGVIVTLRQPEDHLELLIWAAVGEGADLTEKYLPALRFVARVIGAHRIAFKPRRRGWPRLLRRLKANWRMRADGMLVMEV